MQTAETKFQNRPYFPETFRLKSDTSHSQQLKSLIYYLKRIRKSIFLF